MTNGVRRGAGGPVALQVRVDDSATAEDGASIWPVYDAVFHDWSDCDSWRVAVWDKHRGREGFRLARAYDDAALVGFAYGYVGQPGQWWTDNARQVLTPEVAEAWLGGHFELVSIGVVESARGAGVGRALLQRITEDLSQQRWVLMTTADASDPARRLYTSDGWEVIGPGIDAERVIMAKRRP